MEIIIFIALLVIVIQLGYISNALRVVVDGIRALRADLERRDKRA